MERGERAPRPERDHEIGRALYNLSRSWGVAFGRGSTGNAEVKAGEKRALQAELDAVKALVERW